MKKNLITVIMVLVALLLISSTTSFAKGEGLYLDIKKGYDKGGIIKGTEQILKQVFPDPPKYLEQPLLDDYGRPLDLPLGLYNTPTPNKSGEK